MTLDMLACLLDGKIQSIPCERPSPVHLTEREERAWELLRSRHGQTVSRTELMRHVWGHDVHPDRVKHTVLGLRRKGRPVQYAGGRGYRTS
ncbi:MAG TPA: helix-turn-helix domain-containing protein [Candidatus Xenobia bacterium]|jgi:DNA-binding response OmpR family regulator